MIDIRHSHHNNEFRRLKLMITFLGTLKIARAEQVEHSRITLHKISDYLFSVLEYPNSNYEVKVQWDSQPKVSSLEQSTSLIPIGLLMDFMSHFFLSFIFHL